jgi:DNA invertase Pin-like site-specific DNA recombinase
MKFGYARVSTNLQNPELQQDELKKQGCEKIFTDIISGAQFDRPELDSMLKQLRHGDTVVVWRLDRLGRSIKELINLSNHFQELGVNFISCNESINTSTTTGRLIFNIFSSLAEFERELIKERTVAGLNAARARGRTGGRPFKLDNKRIKKLKEYYQDKSIEIKDLCVMFNISRATLYRLVAEK